MKKLLLIVCSILALSGFNKVNASVNITATGITYKKDFKNLELSEFVKLSVNDFSRIMGKKLSLKEKISFSVLQIKMKHSIKKNPHATVGEYLATSEGMGTGWKILLGAAILLMIILIVTFLFEPGFHL